MAKVTKGTGATIIGLHPQAPCGACISEAKKQRKPLSTARPARYLLQMDTGEQVAICEEHFEQSMRPERTH
jgi:hypothetical protein